LGIVPARSAAVPVRAEPREVRNLVVVQILAERELPALQDRIANGRFRDTVRRFDKGDSAQLADLGWRLTFDRDRMIRTRKLNLFFFHVSSFVSGTFS